ncbi:MAG: S1C family serine protease [Candidatus Limnocylindria bacterium]
MTNDPDGPRDRTPTEPIEVQRYGPVPQREPHPHAWQSAPAWSSRPAAAVATEPRRSRLGALPIILIAVIAGIVSGALSAVAVSNALRPALVEEGATDTIPEGEAVSDVRIEESSAVISAVEQVAPSVVTIQSSGGGFLDGASGTGSGFIFDGRGWILTNKHVVQDARDLTVILNDGRRFPASVYGVDTLTDLAIVKIEGENFAAAPIGSSARLEAGQLAIAIGSPLGLQYESTVTTGVVSGLGRQITAADASRTSAETLNNLIQTDAAINPGNSGGPLVNSAGQVIGVNTAVSTSAQGLGFAIPIDVAKPIMAQALAGEELTRPWIGVYYEMITPARAEQLDLPVDYGALIGTGSGDGQAVFPDSPAAAAGLEPGDVIAAVDGTRVDTDNDLSSLIIPHEPGDTITLRVLRGSTTRDITVTLGLLPDGS